MSALKGKTILLTRSLESNRRDSESFRSTGAYIRSVPGIRFTEPESWDECDRAIVNLRKYDAVVFTSANGVRFFLDRIAQVNVGAKQILGRRRIFAVGGATSQALEDAGLSVSETPEAGSAEMLSESIAENAAGKWFLFPRSDIARDVLPSTLRAHDAMVDEVIVYRTVTPESQDLDSVRNDLRNNTIDAVAFFSPSAVRNFIQMIGVAHMEKVPIAVIGPTTAAAIQEAGLHPAIVASRPSVEALIESLDEYFSRSPQHTR